MKVFGLFVSLFFLTSIDLVAQKVSPVSWKFEMKKINTTDYEITATATMQPSWVLYSQFTNPDGPIPTLFLVNGAEVKFEEKSKVIKEHDDMFDVEVMKFKEKSVFIYKGSNPAATPIKGSVEYMTCDGERCLPPVEVAFDLKF
jgi:hypothetical protein